MKRIELKAPLSANVTTDAKLPTRFSGTAYTGAAVSSGLVIDLASTTVPQSMALLSEHGRTDIVGRVESTAKQGGQLIVAGTLFSDMEGRAAQVARLAARGFPFQMSVGLFDFSEQEVATGQRVAVNGRDVVGPAHILRNGTVREVSVVTLGVDPQTNVQFFSANGAARGRAIDKLFSDLGEPLDVGDRQVLLSMAPATFAFLDMQLRSLGATLIARTAASKSTTTLSVKSVYAARRAASARFMH